MLVSLVAPCGASAMQSGSYAIPTDAFTSGGGASQSADYGVQDALGQTNAGLDASVSYGQNIGYEQSTSTLTLPPAPPPAPTPAPTPSPALASGGGGNGPIVGSLSSAPQTSNATSTGKTSVPASELAAYTVIPSTDSLVVMWTTSDALTSSLAWARGSVALGHIIETMPRTNHAFTITGLTPATHYTLTLSLIAPTAIESRTIAATTLFRTGGTRTTQVAAANAPPTLPNAIAPPAGAGGSSSNLAVSTSSTPCSNFPTYAYVPYGYQQNADGTCSPTAPRSQQQTVSPTTSQRAATTSARTSSITYTFIPHSLAMPVHAPLLTTLVRTLTRKSTSTLMTFDTNPTDPSATVDLTGTAVTGLTIAGVVYAVIALVLAAI